MKRIIIILILLILLIAGTMLGIRFRRKRATACGIRCTAQLGTYDYTKEATAMEFNLKPGDTVTDEQILKYVKWETLKKCPSGGKYTINPIGEDPVCSFAKKHSKVDTELHLHQLSK